LTPTAYTFLGLTAIVAALVAIVMFAVTKFVTEARETRRRMQGGGGAETALLSAALQEAVAKLKAQERATAARADASERLSEEIISSLTAGLLVVGLNGDIRILNPAGRRVLDVPETLPLNAYRRSPHEQPLLDCSSHYSGALRVKLGATEPGGRTLMSLVPLQWSGETAVEDPARGVFRIWLDREQVDRLKAGKYFATIVRREGSCWIRGNLEKDPIFLLDTADPAPDTPDAGSFYNQAPRMSAFEGDAYTCRPVK